VLVAAVLFLLHRVALWMEGRGWLYYRTRKSSRASVGNALLELQSLLEPDRSHTVEVRRLEQLEEDESGDPPSTAGGDDEPRGGGPE
jgi:hypothetical protein